MIKEWYSNLLHDSAQKWGLAVPSDRPLIDDRTSQYPQLVVVDTLEWRGKPSWRSARIELVRFNDLWSYTIDVMDRDGGGGFGPSMKFCDPFSTRGEALESATQRIRKYKIGKDLRAWLDSLIQPQQLSLF